MNFSYQNNTQIQFGQGRIKHIAKLIPSDKRVLILYGGGSIKKNGVYDQVVDALSEHTSFEFAGVEANPTAETLDKAVQEVKQNKIDYILAVGGGSVIDGAKYVAGASLYDGEGWDILLGKYKVRSALPIGVVLTLPATGSESNTNSVVTKSATAQKFSFASPAVLPVFAVMDPDVMKTLPTRQLANGVVDAWVHVCEQYLTYPTGALVQDGYAETLLRSLKRLADNFENQDDEWRANMMWSANQALNGLIGAGVPQDWATHMIGHELTALYGVDHARSLAIVQPHLLRNQIESKRAKLEQMGKNVFGLELSDDLAERTISEIEQFHRSLNVETAFSDHGDSKLKVIDKVVSKLESQRMTTLGERGAIELTQVRQILESAIA